MLSPVLEKVSFIPCPCRVWFGPRAVEVAVTDVVVDRNYWYDTGLYTWEDLFR